MVDYEKTSGIALCRMIFSAFRDGFPPAGRIFFRRVTVDVSQSERDALVVRGYLSEEERDDGVAIKKAIEGVISDMVFELQSETAQRP